MKVKFTAWFNRHEFQHFTADELTSYFEVTRRGVTNSYPPVADWNNILPTLRIVDELRNHFGKPVVLLSSFRNAEYNRKCGGVVDSQHRYFRALDIAMVGVTPKQIYDVLIKWRRAGRFTGGVGLYPTFVHIDTRNSNATW